MKAIISIISFFVITFLLLYVFLFTPFGNSFVKPVLEKEMVKELGIDIKLNEFLLNINEFDFFLSINNENTIKIEGNYSLFTQRFNAKYKMNLNSLESFKMRTVLNSRGFINGDLKNMEIDGESNFAGGNSSYHIELDEFKIIRFFLKTRDINIAKILYSFNKKKYVDGKLNIDFDFKNLSLKNIDGIVKFDIIDIKLFKLNLTNKMKFSGVVNGDKKSLSVSGKGISSNSDTRFLVKFEEFMFKSLNLSIDNLNLSDTLFVLKQPNYADGNVSLNIKVDKSKTILTSKVNNGVFNSKTLTNLYKFKTKMPKTTFNFNSESKLNSDGILTDLSLDTSSLLKLDIKNLNYQLYDDLITGDYKIFIEDVKEFDFLTDKWLTHSFIADGSFTKYENLELNFNTKLKNGNIDGKLYKDNLHLNLNSINSIYIAKFLDYDLPFKSFVDGSLDYDLVEENGRFRGKLVKFKFKRNKMLSLLKKYGRVNLYSENYRGNFYTKFSKYDMLFSLYLKSRKIHLRVKDTKIDFKYKKINSKVDLISKKDIFHMKFYGDIDKPNIEILRGR